MRIKAADIVSLLILIAAYCLFRYPLFHLHGMKQWPLALAIAGIAISCLSTFLNRAIISMSTAIGYVAGFCAGLLLHSRGVDAGGGSTDNLWIIWTAVMACFIVAGMLISAVKARREA
mgnify:CR=1 FL=1